MVTLVHNVNHRFHRHQHHRDYHHCYPHRRNRSPSSARIHCVARHTPSAIPLRHVRQLVSVQSRYHALMVATMLRDPINRIGRDVKTTEREVPDRDVDDRCESVRWEIRRQT